MRRAMIPFIFVSACLIVLGPEPWRGVAAAQEGPASDTQSRKTAATGVKPKPATSSPSQLIEEIDPDRLTVTIDVSDAPESAEWSQRAKLLVEKWHPLLAAFLAGPDFRPPTHVKLVFKKEMRAPAYASRDVITISAAWIKAHPEDDGMVVHELTHVIQAYRHGAPGWLVEGIADYTRFFLFEPRTLIRVDPERAGYKDGYRTSAKFLAWVASTYDKQLIPKLNKELRSGEYRDDFFRSSTGKDLNALWSEFTKTLPRSRASRKKAAESPRPGSAPG